MTNDAVKQYEMVKNGTDKIQICVQAGMVVAAYIQANDLAKASRDVVFE